MLKLPSNLDDRCLEWGVGLIEHYARGRSPFSRAVSSHGMHADPEGLADAKRGECIFALEHGFDGHSEKPEEFYAIVRRASYLPAGEEFQRQTRDGFVNLFEEGPCLIIVASLPFGFNFESPIMVAIKREQANRRLSEPLDFEFTGHTGEVKR